MDLLNINDSPYHSRIVQDVVRTFDTVNRRLARRTPSESMNNAIGITTERLEAKMRNGTALRPDLKSTGPFCAKSSRFEGEPKDR